MDCTTPDCKPASERLNLAAGCRAASFQPGQKSLGCQNDPTKDFCERRYVSTEQGPRPLAFSHGETKACAMHCAHCCLGDVRQSKGGWSRPHRTSAKGVIPLYRKV